MAATVLNSQRAIEMSIFVVPAFVRMREALAADQQIGHDSDIQEVVEAIRVLMAPPPSNGAGSDLTTRPDPRSSEAKHTLSWRHSVKPRTISRISSS